MSSIASADWTFTSLLRESAPTTGENNNAGSASFELWKMRRLGKLLEAARGTHHTSMISLLIPPGTQVSKVTKMLGDEMGTASCIKSAPNRKSVLEGLRSLQSRLKLFKAIPPHGLALFTGNVLSDTNATREKRINIAFEPPRPITRFVYYCDNKFYTDWLKEMLAGAGGDDADTYGFIIVDGKAALYATLCGTERTVLHQFSVSLPNKHHKGGQSSLRSTGGGAAADSDSVKIKSLIIAGSADLKAEVAESKILDQRLRTRILRVVDVAYGGLNGLTQAITLTADVLRGVRLEEERKILGKLFGEIANADTTTAGGRYAVGVRDTFTALTAGAVETLIVADKCEAVRVVRRKPATGEESVVFAANANDVQRFARKGWEIYSTELLLDWLAEHANETGASAVEIVTDNTAEGMQFVRGFGGIGAVLRWRIDWETMATEDEEEEEEEAAQSRRASAQEEEEEMW